MTKDIGKATDELLAYRQMLIDRIPGIQPALDEIFQKQALWLEELFQPWVDLAEGKITREEFAAIQAERQAKESAEREAHYGDLVVDGVIELSCEQCSETREWVLDEHDGEYPPIYFTCEDLTGIDCEDDEDDEEEADA